MHGTASTQDLLVGVARTTPGVGIQLLDAEGKVLQRFGEPLAIDWQSVAGSRRPVVGAGHGCLTVRLPGGGEVAAVFVQDQTGERERLLRAALNMIAKCEQLEQDMESMNHSSMQLLEQVSMLGETLPKLSLSESVAETATTGLLACVTATGVRRAVYLRNDARSGLAEVLVYVELDGDGRAVVRPYPLAEIAPADRGILQAILGGGEAVAQSRVADLTGLDEDSPERLATDEVLGVAVTCDDGDRRVGLGVILLCDKAHGGYGAVAARLGSEERQVAVSFASMLGAVLGARQSAELGKELSMAQAIQAQILPAGPALVPGFDLAGDYRTSGDVGGDYFDYVQLADGRTLAVVADVSGHNLASGMMMVSARATLRTLAAVRTDPAQLFADLASGMFTDLTRTERFITAAGVALRGGSPEVEIVNAGHNDLMLYRAAAGSVTRLRAESTVFGFMAHASYERATIAMEQGDCLLLYTDGVTEATDTELEMFGEDRLSQVLAGAASGTAGAIVAAVLGAVHDFRAAGERGDDITVVAIKRTGTSTEGFA